MEGREIEIDSLEPIGFPDFTSQLARESGFLGLIDLLKVAKHGKGENFYLVRFPYLPPRRKRAARKANGSSWASTSRPVSFRDR